MRAMSKGEALHSPQLLHNLRELRRLVQLRAQSYAVSHACATGCDTFVHKAATASAGHQSWRSMPAPSFSDFCSQARPMALACHPDVARNVWEVTRSCPKSRYFAPHLRALIPLALAISFPGINFFRVTA